MILNTDEQQREEVRPADEPQRRGAHARRRAARHAAGPRLLYLRI
jgi:hypothetical protein